MLAASMEREVELHLVGAEDVHRLGLFRHMAPVAVAAVAGRRGEFQTRPDERHGDDPSWNERFTFVLPEWLVRTAATRFELEIFAEPARKNSLGIVHIPLELGRLDGKVRKYFILYDGNKQGYLRAALTLGAQRPPAPACHPGEGAAHHPHSQGQLQRTASTPEKVSDHLSRAGPSRSLRVP